MMRICLDSLWFVKAFEKTEVPLPSNDWTPEPTGSMIAHRQVKTGVCDGILIFMMSQLNLLRFWDCSALVFAVKACLAPTI